MDPGFYRFFRHITPSGFKKWIDRYNYEGQELQDLIQTAPSPIQVQTLDCTVAQTIALEFKYPARAFVIYFYDSTSTTKTIKPNGYVQVAINENRAENTFPAKHNRGYRGDYYRLFLTWPAQANTKADLVMHMFDDDPWEMDSLSQSGTVTSVALADGSTVPIFSISGSPVVGAGTLTETLIAQVKNTVFVGPASGANAQPTFRALVAADISGAIRQVQEVPAGVIGGGNVTFTLSQTPLDVTAVQVFLNGLCQRYTTDFTVAGPTLTFVVAPTGGQSLQVWYIY